ncbi:hypothetical protein AUR64_01315 [Haloprofundus marisrubri]|uniref:DUF2795 domain-containing protein n=1 Tax=Haloprofundus marisrubri TaxID=1514971 RepID=A0A0W1R478_9EURY|nr:hypothetical protein [Haloprofundus marisrubri]KTG07903.1 hypothetical protein AUR64_01315 [Haloprofundus marisrubri]
MRLNRTGDLVADHEYPATTDELVSAYGTETIHLQNGSETVGAVLERLGAQTYADSNEVYDAILTGVGHEAIGRRFYSDRDAPTLGEGNAEQVSF